MFEVVPSPAHHPRKEPRRPLPPRAAGRSRSPSRALAASAPLAAALAAAAGCVSNVDSRPPSTQTPGGGQVHQLGDVPPGEEMTDESPSSNLLVTPCVVGTWVIAPGPCACPAAGAADDTVECSSPDCAQTLALVLRQGGQAFRATVRFSAQTRTLSAIGGHATCGEWHYFDDGELKLAFEGNEKYTPTECDGAALVPKGEPPMERPAPALGDAISWALWTGDWTEVPYLSL